MDVRDHKLLAADPGVKLVPSPNHGGELVLPRFLVMHFTGGTSFQNAVDWLCNPKAKASAHMVIGRAGELVQLVPFNQRAWHAGESRWSYIDADRLHHDIKQLNQCSIGIELENPGYLHRSAIGWKTVYGKGVGGDDVVLAKHKHGGPHDAWHAYTEKQILTAYEACEAIIDAYPSIVDVLGHDDIAPQRKEDPGPAFPMDRFRSWLFGRGQG